MQFSDVVGQQHVKEAMIQSIRDGRISHAQLYLGPEGSGALPLALAYVQYLFCPNRSATDSCGTCPQCRRITKLIHPDVHFVFPVVLKKEEIKKSGDVLPEWKEAFLENNYLSLNDWILRFFGIEDDDDPEVRKKAENKQAVIGKDESIDILHQLSLAAHEGAYKVMIVWMAEKLNLTAANKILKILEEPPEKTIFLLLTESAALPATILSRTQLTKLPRLTDEDIVSALVKRYGITKEKAIAIARASEGNYRYAQVLFAGADEDAEYFSQKFRDWMRICLRADGDKLSEWISNTVSGIVSLSREKQKQFLAYSLQLIRQSLLLGKFAVNIKAGEEEFLHKFSPYLPFESGSNVAGELNKAYHAIERNANPKIVFMNLSLKIHKQLTQPGKITA